MYCYDVLFDRISLPAEAREAFYKAYPIIEPYKEKLTKTFFGGEQISSIIDELAGAAANTEADILWLAAFVILSETTYKMYGEKGVGEDIFYDTMGDLTVWSKVCRRDWGVWGIHNEFGWLSNHLRATLFKLGRLQFELRKFKCEKYINKDGRAVYRGDPVMNIHIPEGDTLAREKRYDSYRRAHEFFGLDVFVCDTWLFYPRHTEFLPPDSNILDFMRDFDIIESSENAGDYGNMWRVFNRRASYDPASLPRDTGLRRAYADWLAKENKTGGGYGVMFYNG